MLILAGDIGGTKSWLAAFDTQQSNSIVAEKIYSSQQFDSLAAVVQEFCRDFQLNPFSGACFGLPGPVTGEQAQLTNLPWLVSSQAISQQCNIAKVKLINDFQAAALGIDAISSDQLVCLQEGRFNPQGNRLVVGAGTGLGVAPVVNTLQGFVPQPCEGGHMDFAPVNELQQRLQKWLWQSWRHLSYERLLSGAGLQALYAFFGKLSIKEQDTWPQPEQVQQWAEEGQAEAIKAINAFVQIYAAYIGNIALLWPAYAGIYIAGGIAAKIEPWMSKEGFLIKLQDKGRMSGLVADMPVYLVKDPALGLKGAMLCATSL
ncbi:MAG: glucokinase [Thiopseudomonas sp.]|nr:glucokinase [Thiopseudomonas sp.]MCK9465900.1 glucokinase [Thiopseudomonas sp.]